MSKKRSKHRGRHELAEGMSSSVTPPPVQAAEPLPIGAPSASAVKTLPPPVSTPAAVSAPASQPSAPDPSPGPVAAPPSSRSATAPADSTRQPESGSTTRRGGFSDLTKRSFFDAASAPESIRPTPATQSGNTRPAGLIPAIPDVAAFAAAEAPAMATRDRETPEPKADAPKAEAPKAEAPKAEAPEAVPEVQKESKPRRDESEAELETRPDGMLVRSRRGYEVQKAPPRRIDSAAPAARTGDKGAAGKGASGKGKKPSKTDPGRSDHHEVHEAFFQRGELVEKEHLEAHAKGRSEPPQDQSQNRPLPIVITPEMRERKRKLRRVVGFVVAGAALLVVIGGVKLARDRDKQTPLGDPSRVASVAPPPRASQTAAAIAPARSAAPVASPSASVAAAPSAEPAVSASASAQAAASAAPSASVATSSTSDIPEGVNAKKEAESLLNRGRYKDAIRYAEAAIERDPEDALPYLLLGSALQSSGKWKEGIAAYSRCVHAAKKGPVHECRAVGGR